MGPEQKLYRKLKSKTPKIIWNRIENLTIPGMPDLLGYNANKHFFTVELKVTKGKKIRFSPHQISFHVTHPENTFILVQTLGQGTGIRFQLYPGSGILALQSSGRDLEPFCLGLDAIRDFLYLYSSNFYNLCIHCLAVHWDMLRPLSPRLKYLASWQVLPGLSWAR